jgi:hypothetical protein
MAFLEFILIRLLGLYAGMANPCDVEIGEVLKAMGTSRWTILYTCAADLSAPRLPDAIPAAENASE